RNGQVITRDFFAGILRLDVDGRENSLPPNPHPAYEAFLGNYRIPADNPFVGATEFLGQPIADPASIRTEFFAVGLRNPWRMSFDPETGELWVADVGQGARESIFITRNGANHGWPFREGPIAGPRSGAPAGFTTQARFDYVAPIHSYSHGNGPTQGRSITGGFVYRGTQFPALTGAYVFADYVSGNVWALRRQAVGAPRVERLLGEVGISAFGRDPRDGDILIADLDGGRILRLVPGSPGGQALPATLADTGAFTDLVSLTPAVGVVPYEINLPFWSDGATKQRWFHVPGTNRLSFASSDPWGSPSGTVWVKHFELPTGTAPEAPRQRIETRFLVRNDDGVYGVTYRWTSATDAVLVGDEGDFAAYTVGEGPAARTVNWRFPSRGECLACHNAAAGGSLSFETAQLARNIQRPDGTSRDQIGELIEAGYFHNPPNHPTAYRRHPALNDESVSLEARARSYLAVNCAPCHRPGGTVGGGFFDTRLETPTDIAGLLSGPLNDSGEDPGARVIVPGEPGRSELLLRLLSVDNDRMPPISSGVVDDEGTALLERWIVATSRRTNFSAWLDARFGPAIAEAADRSRDADADGATDYLEFLTDTDPEVSGDGWRLRAVRDAVGGGIRLRFRHPADVALTLEIARDPVAGPWEPWWVEGSGTEVPSEGVERDLFLDDSDEEVGARYVRARVREL
ncbi:MAG: PQQ-dependent sugar dehydrogenase, partial [Limisphaerales bacterium]